MTVLTLGSRVRTRREEKGLTREDAAREAGMSTATLARIELNDHVPNARALGRLAELLDLPLSDLVSSAPAEPAAS